MKNLYPNNNEAFDRALFKNPPYEYRSAPFWAWNCELNQETLLPEIDCMRQMGMGGFHIHPRLGMYTPYLSDEYMECVKTCVGKAKQDGMRAWLYDEDRYPSGFAGGMVVEKDVKNWQRYLLFSRQGFDARAHAPERKVCPGDAELLGRYEVKLNKDGFLLSYRRLSDSEEAKDDIWYAWLEYSLPTPRFHNKGYVDTMNPSAIHDFIQVTHERYKEWLRDEFGKTIPAIFTDEPQMKKKRMLSQSHNFEDVILPYTPDFEATYRCKYGESFLDHLPEVIWDLPKGVSLTRYRYHDLSTELFVQAFCDQIGAWCVENNLYMTGHMLDEPTLASQTTAVGECMRAYRAFTLPGIDMLFERREYTTVIQAASAAHQQGCPAVLSELYGVTNWDYDFRGHKVHGDWQAALGVTLRVHHHYWASMHGESKRDYPASIGHQSSWYKEYSLIEDHFARISTAMTRGKAHIRVGVIHPIESYWLHFGPEDTSGDRRNEIDRRFQQLTELLLKRTINFDFICESTLPNLYKATEKGLQIGEMNYETVVVPGCETLRSATVEALTAFAHAGGKVIFMGPAPIYMDGISSSAPNELYKQCTQIEYRPDELIRELEAYRDVEILTQSGIPADYLVYGMRNDGNSRNLFICHCNLPIRAKQGKKELYRIIIKGTWKLTVLDTMTGDISSADALYREGKTEYLWQCYDQASLLLRLDPGMRAASPAPHISEYKLIEYLNTPEAYTLHEENVYLIDMAEWRIDDGPWKEKEEMLRIELCAKETLGLNTETMQTAQPWFIQTLEPEKEAHVITLKCDILSDIDLNRAWLGVEDHSECEIWLNGRPVSIDREGYYTDEAISKLPFGPIHAGKNELIVKKRITAVTNLENMFLLGDFGVRVTGREIRIVLLPSKLYIGTWTDQGLPFYSGELTYCYHIDGGRHLVLFLGQFNAPCVTVSIDGKKMGNVSLAPYSVDLGYIPEGIHGLAIHVFPSRINTFGAFHLADYERKTINWDAYRTKGTDWSYNYRLTSSGLLSEPLLYEALD